MCGIAGWFGAPKPELDAWLSNAVVRLHHRGPDARGIRSLGNLGAVGATRLRIVDLGEAADQPLHDPASGVTVVFNGEIYNHRSLRDRLERAGRRFRTSSDTEVVAQLFAEQGVDGFVQLHGMFAFALWDERRRSLHLVRDRLGIKPLYIARERGTIRFASEARLLGDGAPIREGAIDELLTLGWISGPATMWEGIEELPPGHVLTLREDSCGLEPYWHMDDLDGPPTNLAGLRGAFVDSVARHLDADADVGIFLSAGIDSAAIAAAAVELGHRPLSITVAHSGARSEHVGAEACARSFRLPHHVAWVQEDDLIEQIDPFLAALDQPTVDGLNTFAVSGALRAAGLRVGLSGLGGDELLGGYSTFRHVPRIRAVQRRLGVVPAAVRERASAATLGLPLTRRSRLSRVVEMVASSDDDAWQAVRAVRSHRQLLLVRPRGQVLSHLVGRDVRTLEVSQYLRNQLLRDTDVLSMAHSIEVRVPYLDDGVVEAAWRLPVDLRRADTKRNLLTAMFPLTSSTGRGKRTFTLPIDSWLRGPLRGRVDQTVSDLLDADVGFSARGLRDDVAAWEHRHADWRQIWVLVVLAAWLRSSHAHHPGAT